jgi:hypothetical protein
MTAEGGRPQDQGRTHRRRGRHSPETTALLGDYQAAMRAELRAVLGELEGVDPPPGLDLDGKPPERQRPKLDVRMKLWDLAIKVGRELGAAIDADPPATDGKPQTTPKRSRARVDYGPDR